MVKETYLIRLAEWAIDLYSDVSPRELSSPGKLEAGRKVRVVTERPPWVLVQAGSVKGFLPKWYLTRYTANILPDIVLLLT